ncbi:Glycine/sarcosine N-methyltransferase [Planctomycetes bacterium Pan216]|uniref:Glycine/sarcosine N-methyltransferase n=1 Tax=Kolteria novifilia TaxID=2527975 RepID=A0A518B6A4_9BACT|nr:Glycine/sarcosine N-methyltransferase [Planctomycetes bacterium Pan216]
MSTEDVKEHYETLLAEHYTWMCGDFDRRVEETIAFFRRLTLETSPERALDLGCGSGIQSIALAQLGYEVTAVDFQASLLEELRELASGLSIKTIESNLTALDPSSDLGGPFDLAVCMGDTLPHLPDADAVRQLISSTAKSRLKPEGRFIVGFRDLSQELTGSDRAIPVRLDDDRVMLTFLEYLPERVMVHDMVLDRRKGEWQLQKNAYPKLRLSEVGVKEMLTEAGFTIEETSVTRGMCHLVAHRS